MDVIEFLGGKHEGEGRWAFAFGEHINGAFGGVFGGAIAAACLTAARAVAPGRVPAGIDCRFLRALSSAATVTASVVHEGRTLAAVDARVVDERDRTTTSAGITLVNAEALHPLTRESAAFELSTAGGGAAWRAPPTAMAPIIDALAPRMAKTADGGIACTIRVPWQEDALSPEAMCMAGDVCVGPPVGGALETWVPHPNPDLSLRFGAPVRGDPVVGVGRLRGIQAGLALVGIEVFAVGSLAAIGVSYSLLLRQ